MYIVQLEIGTEKSIESLSIAEVLDILSDIPKSVEYSAISNKLEIIGSNFFIKIESTAKNMKNLYATLSDLSEVV